MPRFPPGKSCLFAALLLCATACDKRNADASDDTPSHAQCAALRITVNGEPLNLRHGLGRLDEHSEVYLISLFNTDAVRCKEFTQTARLTTPGELEVRASVAANLTHTVGIGSHTQLIEHAYLMKPPEQPGERFSICVPQPVTFTPSSGPLKGQKVQVVGRFEGLYCGAAP